MLRIQDLKAGDRIRIDREMADIRNFKVYLSGRGHIDCFLLPSVEYEVLAVETTTSICLRIGDLGFRLTEEFFRLLEKV